MKKIYLIGDSTCQNNDETTFPQTGWGQVFHKIVKDEYEVINLAKNGRSTKSFIDEGLFKVVEENIKAGDYLFIQFGHNDEKDDPTRHTDPYTSYQDNLLYFINTARNNGAIPVLLSSIYRRHFDENGKIMENVHLQYPKACQELAKREKVIFIDMCELTKQSLIKIGDEDSKRLFMYFEKEIYSNYPDGKKDNTHLRYEGAMWIIDILKTEIKKDNKLQKILKD